MFSSAAVADSSSGILSTSKIRSETSVDNFCRAPSRSAMARTLGLSLCRLRSDPTQCAGSILECFAIDLSFLSKHCRGVAKLVDVTNCAMIFHQGFPPDRRAIRSPSPREGPRRREDRMPSSEVSRGVQGRSRPRRWWGWEMWACERGISETKKKSGRRPRHFSQLLIPPSRGKKKYETHSHIVTA